MDAPSPVPSAVLARLKQHYESAYDVLKKNLKDHHTQIVAVQEELISSQSQQIFSYEKQLQAQGEKLVGVEAHVLVLQDEIAELKERLARVAESVAGVGRNNATQRMSDYSTQHDQDNTQQDQEDGGRVETVSEQAVLSKKDLSLRRDKELPPRPESTVSSLLDDIDDMIIEIEDQPDMDVSSVSSVTDFMKSSSSQGALVLQQAMAPQLLSPGFYHMSSPTYAFAQQPRSSTASPRLQPISEGTAMTSTSNLNSLSFNEFQPIITERIQTNSPVLRPRSSLQSQSATPRVLAETHPLLRQLSPLSQTTTSSEYSQRTASPSPGSKYPPIKRKETFIEKLKPKQTFKIPKPYKNRKSTSLDPDPGETDSIIREKIRTEAERRKAANFGPGDKVEKSGVIHSMTLSPAESSEIRPMSLGARPKTKGFENPQLGAVKRVASAGSKGTEGSRGRMRNVVRRWKSDLWKVGPESKRMEE